MNRTVALVINADHVAGVRWPAVALSDGSPDPVRVAVPVRGLDGPVDLPLDRRAADRMRHFVRFRRFGFRVLMPVFGVVTIAYFAARILAGSALAERLGWLMLGFYVVFFFVMATGALRYRVRQLPHLDRDGLVVPAVDPGAAQALQHLNEPGVVALR
ncbi:hypothetical protein [Dactylosporangium sp. NPDC051541]|uniref:hypothetical protein n=1 Tax=Dactylosporangium sp. NPDC051541 TaxID=3363977 RepID=UPI0037B23970